MSPLSRETIRELLSSLEVTLPERTTLTDELLRNRLRQSLDHAQYITDAMPNGASEGKTLDVERIKPWSDSTHGDIFSAFVRGSIEEAGDEVRKKLLLGGKTAKNAQTPVDAFTGLRQSLYSVTKLLVKDVKMFCLQDIERSSAIFLRMIQVLAPFKEVPVLVVLYKHGTQGELANSIHWTRYQVAPSTGLSTDEPQRHKTTSCITAAPAEQQLMVELLDMNAARLPGSWVPERDPLENDFGLSFLIPIGPIEAVSLGWLSRNDGCVLCGREGGRQCSACHVVSYCSKECQTQDWPAHKPMCRSLKGANWMDIRFSPPPGGGRNASIHNRRDQLGKRPQHVKKNTVTTKQPTGADAPPPDNAHGKDAFMIKVQHSGNFIQPMMIYDRRRTFGVSYERSFTSDAEAAKFDELAAIIAGNVAGKCQKVYCWARRVGDWELAVAFDKIPDQDFKW